jgi:hypothetical protein
MRRPQSRAPDFFLLRANMFDKSKPGYLQMSSVFEELPHLKDRFYRLFTAMILPGDAAPAAGLAITRSTPKIHIIYNRWLPHTASHYVQKSFVSRHIDPGQISSSPRQISSSPVIPAPREAGSGRTRHPAESLSRSSPGIRSAFLLRSHRSLTRTRGTVPDRVTDELSY